MNLFLLPLAGLCIGYAVLGGRLPDWLSRSETLIVGLLVLIAAYLDQLPRARGARMRRFRRWFWGEMFVHGYRYRWPFGRQITRWFYLRLLAARADMRRP